MSGLGLCIYALLSQAKHLQLTNLPIELHYNPHLLHRLEHRGSINHPPNGSSIVLGPATASSATVAENRPFLRVSELVTDRPNRLPDPIIHHGCLHSLRKRHLPPPPKSLF